MLWKKGILRLISDSYPMPFCVRVDGQIIYQLWANYAHFYPHILFSNDVTPRGRAAPLVWQGCWRLSAGISQGFNQVGVCGSIWGTADCVAPLDASFNKLNCCSLLTTPFPNDPSNPTPRCQVHRQYYIAGHQSHIIPLWAGVSRKHNYFLDMELTFLHSWILQQNYPNKLPWPKGWIS
jgi:hypothetical protein